MLKQILEKITNIFSSAKKVRELEDKLKAIEETNDSLHNSTMMMALALTEHFNLLKQISLGDLKTYANEVTGDDLLDQLGKITNDLINSMRNLSETADKIASGNLSIKLTARSENDLLVNAFIKMANNLKSLIGNVNNLSGTTSDAASQMADNTKQVRETMTQVQNSIQQIASATNQIAKSASGISSLVQNASSVADSATANIVQVMEKFSAVQKTMEITGHSVSKLNTRSLEITEILNLISKIADQNKPAGTQCRDRGC